MSTLKQLAPILLAMAFIASACGDDDTGSTATAAASTSSSAPAPAATAAPTTTGAPATTAAPVPTTASQAIVIGEPDADGVVDVAIDGEQLDPLFDTFQGGADPFYQIHTQQDDLFVGLELYTVFGDAWTGQLGTFPADCGTHGICVYLDPDGTGPLAVGGPGTGTVTITQLEGGAIVTIDELTVETENGQVYTLSGLTLTG